MNTVPASWMDTVRTSKHAGAKADKVRDKPAKRRANRLRQAKRKAAMRR